LLFAGSISLQYKPMELVLYRIIQELIQNIVKHSEANEAFVEIEQSLEILKIIVEDNGKGFNINKITTGLGLHHLQHRVRSLQGTMTVESAPGKGTTVNMSFDIAALKNIMTYEHQNSNNG
jgi:two-component system, NarL family, sensor kinase